MSYKNILRATINAFEQKMSEFCENGGQEACETLNPESFEKLTRAILVAAQAGGKAGLKTYLESHDTHASSVCSKGIRYRYKNSMEKTFLTLLGGVVVSRSIYANDLIGEGYHVPMDEALGLSDDYATLETREMILFAASITTPGDVEALLRKTGLCRPSCTAIQNMINRDGRRMEEHRLEVNEKVSATRQIPENTAVIVASIDGANLMLREKGKKKGRKTQRPVNAQEHEEKNTAFRNAMVGAISFYSHDGEGTPDRISSRYIARAPEEKAPIFKQDFECMVNDYGKKLPAGDTVKKVFLCDGHRAIWKYAYDCQVLKDHEFLIDFFHSTEHLSKAAEAIFGASSPEGTHWYTKWRDALKCDAGAPQSIVRSMEGYLLRYKLPKTRAADLKKELTFFKRNKRLMAYSSFIAKGYPIGSGPVEAAAKTIVKQRMCQSGMRWNRTGAQYILTFRAHAKSGTWSQMWNAYTELLLAA